MIEGQAQRKRNRRPAALLRHPATAGGPRRLLHRADQSPRGRYERQGEEPQQQRDQQKAIGAHDEILLLRLFGSTPPRGGLKRQKGGLPEALRKSRPAYP